MYAHVGGCSTVTMQHTRQLVLLVNVECMHMGGCSTVTMQHTRQLVLLVNVECMHMWGGVAPSQCSTPSRQHGRVHAHPWIAQSICMHIHRCEPLSSNYKDRSQCIVSSSACAWEGAHMHMHMHGCAPLYATREMRSARRARTRRRR